MKPSPHYLGAEKVGVDAVTNAGSRPLRRPTPLVKVQDLAYVIFQRPELDKQQSFLEDFGMRLAEQTPNALYFRGDGSSPWFYCVEKGEKARYIGAGYTVREASILGEIAIRHDVPIEPLEGPGGGHRVRLRDPDGFVADFVHGREPAQRSPGNNTLPAANTPGNKTRVNAPVRTTAQPCPLEKLGHAVMAVTDFERSSQWYMENLGVIPTDVLCVADGTPVLAFTRCDLGDTPADHHTVVLVQNMAPGLMHTAYETLGLDDVGQGAQYLRWKGWKHFWGIGRHILGSQIFDYWLDPYGVEHEHYADGDVFTADHPTQYHPMDRGGLWSWGDDHPPMQTPGLLAILKLMLSGRGKKMLPLLNKMRAALAHSPRPWLK